MLRVLLISFLFAANSFSEESITSKVPEAVPAAAASPTEEALPKAASEDGEYEIDYEEEPDNAVQEEVAPAPKKGKKNKLLGGGSGGVQGSRAMNRFAPILKSETKSIYKKEGRALDVDSD